MIGPLLTKKRLRLLLNVHASTLQRWLNKVHFEELEKLGCRKNQKYFTGKLLSKIIELFVIVDDE
jgi:hypothetical protein